MRDLVDLGQSSISVNTAALPQSSKTEENHNTWRSWRSRRSPPSPPFCCSKKEIEDEEIDARATKPSWYVLLCCVGTESGAVHKLT